MCFVGDNESPTRPVGYWSGSSNGDDGRMIEDHHHGVEVVVKVHYLSSYDGHHHIAYTNSPPSHQFRMKLPICRGNNHERV